MLRNVKKISFYTVIVLSVIIAWYRISYLEYKSDSNFKVTTWDALGYYLFLPAIFVYHDYTQLDWLSEVDAKYSLSGGKLYQVSKLKNGNQAGKYLCGVAILQLPFFLFAHSAALILGYQADGFSPIYQYAIAFGAVVYFILALFILRKVLLRLYDEINVTVVLLLMVLSTNLIQYVSIDSAQSHAYIFPLYVIILWLTMSWHDRPGTIRAFFIGFIIGLATISRPTEAIMLFIPLLYNTHTKEAAKQKWKLVKEHKNHLIYTALGGIIGVLPQLIYWKLVTGSFIYDVGSKWDFLMPHFSVLFGFNKGWFVYTPVTIFFVIGLFMMKNNPFKKSVLTFCLLNIYIIISWHDYRYGGSYSARALVQSYPVFAIALGAFIQKILKLKWNFLLVLPGLYLIFVNLFQIWQYNHGVLHFYEMNRKVYGQIYLRKSISPLQASLFDNDDWLSNEKKYAWNEILNKKNLNITLNAKDSVKIADTLIAFADYNRENWLKIESAVFVNSGLEGSYFLSELTLDQSKHYNRQKLQNELTDVKKMNQYAFFVKVPTHCKKAVLQVYLISHQSLDCHVHSFSVKQKGN